MGIEDLVARAFAIRDAAHLAHWATNSYSKHKTLGKFYDRLIDKLDGIVEAYQGWYDLLGPVKQFDLPADDIVVQIGDEAAWVSKHRDEIAKGNPMLENLLDDYTQLFSSTYYMLRHLG